MSEYPLLPETCQAVCACASRCNPGLLLDRFAAYPDRTFSRFDQEKGQLPHIQLVSKASAAHSPESRDILRQWEEFVGLVLQAPGRPGTPGIQPWTQKTVWRLTLHLSRASSVENGAICLHPIYGFAYLPATGLKGLARAYATTEGAVSKGDRDRVFGPEREGIGAAGSVIFHDAWPARWPTLVPDIVNNHHTEYYRSRGGLAPGDWENPNPVYFLAVEADTPFRFAVSPRPGVAGADKDADLAKEWLQKALQTLGAGAKTAAGYGYFDEPRDLAVATPAASPGDEAKARVDRYCATTDQRERKKMRRLLWGPLRQLKRDDPEACRQLCAQLRRHDEGIINSPDFQEVAAT